MRLKDWRKGAGMSAETFAGMIGVTRANVTNIETGYRNPSASVAIEIDLLTDGEVPAATWFPGFAKIIDRHVSAITGRKKQT